LHGLFHHKEMWVPPTEHLTDVSAPLAIDLTEHETIPAYAELGLDTAPATFALAGFSMGGYVAPKILRRAPERVRQLALIGTSVRGDPKEQTTERWRRIRHVEAGQ
jgi:pimeloyl-ACP methyl ester carboxylesterase